MSEPISRSGKGHWIARCVFRIVGFAFLALHASFYFDDKRHLTNNPMLRRDLLALIGGVAVWPVAGRAPAQTAPVIGFLNPASPASFARLVEAFRQGLSEEGYVEGRNVAIEYRWAEGHYDRLEGHAVDLVRRGVSLIAATGGVPAARAAKAATATIPILFISGVDPVRAKLVASISRPGVNATGITVITSEMVAKRLELLHELAPRVRTVVMFQYIAKPYRTAFDQQFVAQVESMEAASAARKLGLLPLILDAAREGDLEAGLEAAVKNGADGLLVSADPFFTERRDQIVALAARHGLPAFYPWRQYTMAGGLASYGPDIADVYRQIGRFAGRILKGARPETIPIQRANDFEFVINLKTVKALGLTVSPWLLAMSNETIE